MRLPKTRAFLRSPSVRLAETYLLIIMVMSLGFSVVFYRTSAHELGRQIPPDSFFNNNQTLGFQPNNPQPSVDRFLQQRADEGRSSLFTKLIFLNLGALAVGSGLSYYLARRSLRPIEAAMEAQSQFVSDASHELRTPLTAIQSSNEVALRRSAMTLKQAKEVIAHNTEDVKRLKELSDGLLNLAQHNKTDIILGPVSLQDVVSQAMTQIVAAATAKALTVDDAVADLEVVGEAATLRQVLVILLDNAVKYSDPQGTIYLESQTKGKVVYLQVRDQGIGIRASDMPHIFRRFYRADNARGHGERGGYGLGLAIAQQLIANQHGTISVISQPGQGSTFSLRLMAA